jgi:sialidase-1
MFVVSTDRGRTWSQKRPLTAALYKKTIHEPHWNGARVTTLRDGRLCAVVDRVSGEAEGSSPGGEQSNWIFFSADESETWTGPYETPVHGIVPDRLIELRGGRWLLSAHTVLDGTWTQRVWKSQDQGQTWEGPFTIAAEPDLMLCEGSLFELPGGEICCLMRENSSRGIDAIKAVSRDAGETWSAVSALALPGCHRPVGGMLSSGRVLITYRFMQGGNGWLGTWTQNLFAAVTDVESCLAPAREQTRTRIMPLDFDRSPVSDLGYSGWVQFEDGEIYVVNYIVDDAPKAHIRGYSFRESDMLIESSKDAE